MNTLFFPFKMSLTIFIMFFDYKRLRKELQRVEFLCNFHSASLDVTILSYITTVQLSKEINISTS